MDDGRVLREINVYNSDKRAGHETIRIVQTNEAGISQEVQTEEERWGR